MIERGLRRLRQHFTPRRAAEPTPAPESTAEELKAWTEARFTNGEFLCQITGHHITLFGFLSAKWYERRLYLPYDRYGNGSNASLIDEIVKKNNLRINDRNFVKKHNETWAKLGIKPGLVGQQKPQAVFATTGAGGDHAIHFFTLEEIASRQGGKDQARAAAEFAKVIESAIPGAVVTPIDPNAFQQS